MATSLKTVIFCVTFLFICFSKYYVIGYERYGMMTLLIQCETDKDCSAIETPGYKCRNNVCTCTIDECERTQMIIDVPITRIGITCRRSTQCMVKHSFCSQNNKKCECIENTVSNSDRRRCLNVSTYGSTCEEDSQCAVFNGICLDQKCVCAKSKHLLNEICYNTTESVLQTSLKLQCKTDKDCNGFGVAGYKCIDNVCTCTKDECQEMNLVINASVTKIGKTCHNSAQCVIENSWCGNNEKCECQPNTVSSFNKKKCLKVPTSTYESTCEEDGQCVTFNAICLDSKCVCAKNNHLINETCYKSVELGSACEKNEECSITEFSSCQENRCTCHTNYVKSLSKSACLPKAKRFKSKCFEDIQCTTVLGSGAFCSSGFCKCRELYQYKEDTKKCVMDTLLGGKCSKHEECHQPGDGERRLECIVGECKCKSLYTEESGFCILSSAEGSTENNGISKLFPYILSYILFLTIF